MRDIKFRAWDKKEKKWLLGYEYESLGGFSLFGECMLLGEWSGVLNRFIVEQGERKPEDLVVMQYTGLLDKNGNEIYEGDIVRSTGNLPTEVIWEKDGWTTKDCWITYQDEPGRAFSESEDWEVIGNIYENPELLNSID